MIELNQKIEDCNKEKNSLQTVINFMKSSIQSKNEEAEALH